MFHVSGRRRVKREFIKDVSKYLPAQVAPAIAGLVFIPIITRILTPYEYGNFTLVMATISFYATLETWLSSSVIRFYPAYEKRRELSMFYNNILKLTGLYVLVLAVLSTGLLLALKERIDPALPPLLGIGLLIFALSTFYTVFVQFLRAKRLVNAFSLFKIWRVTMGIVIGLGLFYAFHTGVKGLFWGHALCLFAALPILFRKGMGNVPIGGQPISMPFVKEIAWYGFPLVAANLCQWILSVSDRYVLGYFRGSGEVGIYSASYRVSERSIMLIVSLFMLAAGPLAMSIWEREGEQKSREFLTTLTRLYLIFCVPILAMMTLLAVPIVDVLTGKEFRLGYRIVPFVTAGSFCLGMAQIYQSGLAYHKRTSPIMLSYIIACVVNVGLNLILIPHYGYMAAAANTLISYMVLFILVTVLSKRVFTWNFPFTTLIKVLPATILMSAVLLGIDAGLRVASFVKIIVAMCAGGVVYMVSLLLLREFTSREIKSFLDMMTLRRRDR